MTDSELLELIKKLTSDGKAAVDLIESLNEIASNYDSYECGLPIHDEAQIRSMTLAIVEWLVGLMKSVK